MKAIDRAKLKSLHEREERRKALMSPATTEPAVDLHTRIFSGALRELIAKVFLLLLSRRHLAGIFPLSRE
jgi:hypothetical protein